MGDFIEADFIGGVWDGKTYAIPVVPEWKVAIMPTYKFWATDQANKPFEPDVAVYKNIGHGIFWLSRIEKR